MQQNIKIALIGLKYLEEKHLEVAEIFQKKADEWKNSQPGKLAEVIATDHKIYANNMTLLKELLTKNPKKVIKKIESIKTH